MHLHGLSLQYFRNHQLKTFLFPHQTTVIVGPNAAGKTSIIEAAALLSTGESFRAEQVAEMVMFDQDLARVKGKVIGATHSTDEDETSDNPEITELEVVLTRGELDGKRVQSKLYSVNDVRRRKKDFVAKFFTVVFRPEDMRLVEGSPTRRRHFIDTALSVSDPGYAVSLKTYEDGLKRRNRLLDQVQAGQMPRTVLSFWTSLILKHGQVLQEKRRQFFALFASVTFPLPFTIEYLPSVISETRLNEYAEKEVAAGHTLIGPHKDDFVVKLVMSAHVSDISLYGSRGQQRLAVLWLKLCEFQYLVSVTGQQPLLLLDDILSELDVEHRRDVIALLLTGQAIVTTTEEKVVEEVQQQLPQTEVLHFS